MKNIAILGSTGSVGINTLDVIAAFPDKFKVVGLTANSNSAVLARQIKRFRPGIACVMSGDKIKGLKKDIGRVKTRIVSGLSGLEEVAAYPGAEMVVLAIVGSVSLLPLLKAIEAKKDIALASKEALVSGGEIVMKAAAQKGVTIIPVDSEHSAIFQCLNSSPGRALRKIYLTGTGGPLRNIAQRVFRNLTPKKVINHPKWKMGKKISVDSATLMNKGLEVIEAMRLFSAGLEQIEVIIHPEAVVHSMVEFIDGSVLAQMAVCDMRLPIQYALGYPQRLTQNFSLRLDFKKANNLTFQEPDIKKFPCLRLACEAARGGGTYPAALNASNEEAVASFLDGRIRFTKIPEVIEAVLSRHRPVMKPDLDDILNVDRSSREEARIFCSR